MKITLRVTAGPHAGKEFAFDQHDTFLVGRAADAHLKLSYDDPYFSRRHFLVEVNPPRIRMLDLNSSNGTLVNGQRVQSAELQDGDEVQAGNTIFRVHVPALAPEDQCTMHMPREVVLSQDRTAKPVDDSPAEIPGYRLGPELGRGGMGVVNRAVRLSDSLPVALKTMLPVPGVSDRQIGRFLREARVLAGLTHRNIVNYYDSGSVDSLVYLAMELVEGPDASRIIKERGPLSISAAVRVTHSLLSGLDHAHAQGYVHRDIKPSNLLIGGSPGKRIVKIADFGLARVYDDCKLSGLTLHGDVGGTPAFMAPEQVTHYRHVGPAADQFSAAATLYYLLTGTTPVDLSSKVSEQLVQIVSQDAVPILDRRADLPAELAQAIHRGLDREPARRFPDVGAFRKALAPFA